MKLSQYGYEFKPEMLAKYPAENRDEARLMVVNRAKGTIEHRIFKDIIDYFDEGDLFVFNDTKVFPARLYGNKEKTGAEIEIFLLRELNRELRLWDVLVDPARKIRIGNKLYFGDDDLMVAEVIDNTTSRGRTLRFLFDGDYDEFKTALFKLGETPLPRWVREKVEPEDSERYQTIFAAKEGAVVAPTAGMHFSKHLMKRMEIRGVERAFLTLHARSGEFPHGGRRGSVEAQDGLRTVHRRRCDGRLRQPRQTERPQGRFDRDDGHADARNGRFDQRYDQCGGRAGPTSSSSRPTSSRWPTRWSPTFTCPIRRS